MQVVESPEGRERLADAVKAEENVEDVTQAMQVCVCSLSVAPTLYSASIDPPCPTVTPP